MIYTKAIFNLQVDSTLAGFDVHIWVRWTDTHNPERAGEWSERHIIPIR